MYNIHILCFHKRSDKKDISLFNSCQYYFATYLFTLNSLLGGYFENDAEDILTGINKDNPDAYLYSRLDEIDSLNNGESYHFKYVQHDQDNGDSSYEWIQSSNPAISSTIDGYVPVHADQSFYGIGLNVESHRQWAIIDSSPTSSNFHLAIGQRSSWNSGLLGWDGKASRIELYMCTVS